MLSAACPSCGAPIQFAHAAAVATICQRCRSTVVRGDRDQLGLAGKASTFPRDLSPILVGSHGQFDKRQFVVVTPEATIRESPAQFVALPLFDGEIGIAAAQLDLHDDPVDRIIVATTQLKGGILLTADQAILEWNSEVERFDARR